MGMLVFLLICGNKGRNNFGIVVGFKACESRTVLLCPKESGRLNKMKIAIDIVRYIRARGITVELTRRRESIKHRRTYYLAKQAPALASDDLFGSALFSS